MCEEVWSIWMLIYFCMHLTCFVKLAFGYFQSNYFSSFPNIASVFSGLV
jgi:hypothetical protein